MIVAFDASVLVYVLDERAKAPSDPATGLPLVRCKERVEHLIETLRRQDARIVVPSPVLAELLVRAGEAGPEWIRILGSRPNFRIADFDVRAAVEFAAMRNKKTQSGIGDKAATRAKAKFDDQIVAIACVEGASVIYSDDKDIARLAGGGFEVSGISDLPLPPEEPQFEMELPGREKR